MDAGKLLQLARKSLEILDSKIQVEEVYPRKQFVIRYEVTRLEVSESGASASGTFVPHEKNDWSTVVHDIVEKEIKVLPIFKKNIESVVREYKDIFTKEVNKKSQAEVWLSNFVRKVIYDKLENKLTDGTLVDNISTFINELNSVPILRRLTAYLDGVFLKLDFIELDEDIVMRKPRPADLEYEYLPFISTPRPRFQTPTAVLEIKMRAKDDFALYEKMEKILNLFRIYRLGSVHSLWYSSPMMTIMWPAAVMTGWSNVRFSTRFKYGIDESDITALRGYYEIFEPLLPIKPDKQWVGLNVALSRYNSAILEPIDVERKVMLGVMGLEALYSLPSDRGELEFRLSSRVARLLSFLGLDPMKTRRDIGKSYKIRSSVAHGSMISEDMKKKAGNLLNEVLQYLRKSLIVFMFLGKTMNKNRLVALIDNSMISVDHYNEIREKIKTMLLSMPFEL